MLEQIRSFPQKRYVVGRRWPNVQGTLFYMIALRLWGRSDPHGGGLATIFADKLGLPYYTALACIQLAATARTKAEAKELALLVLEGYLCQE